MNTDFRTSTNPFQISAKVTLRRKDITASTTVDSSETIFNMTFQTAFAEEVMMPEIHRAIIPRAFGNLSETSFHSHIEIFLIHPGRVWVPNFQQARGIFAKPLPTAFPNRATFPGNLSSPCLHQGPKSFRFFQHHAQHFEIGLTIVSFGMSHKKNFGTDQQKNSRKSTILDTAFFTRRSDFLCACFHLRNPPRLRSGR